MSTESRQVLPVQLGDVANPKQSTGPRRIVQSADFVGRGAAAPIKGAPAPILVNHGGPVLGSVEVVPIYWGNAWANGGNATLSTQLDEFFDFMRPALRPLHRSQQRAGGKRHNREEHCEAHQDDRNPPFRRQIARYR